MWACCPFHHEKSPSFSVAPDKGIFKCFGCGKAGDAITFVMEIENLSFGEAIKHLAGKYGIEVPEEAPQPQDLQEQQEKESIYLALKFASQFYQQQLHEHPDGKSLGLSYLKERGLPNKAIEKFELGYSPPAWDGLLQAALKVGYSQQVLEKAGLIICKEDGKVYDRFRGRIMFPIHSVSAKPIAFGARQLTQDKKSPKYINSPETEVYHKSNVLYGIHLAKGAMRRLENCYLVEGYTDVISLHLNEIENVVASSGTSLTEEQIRLIKRYCPQVTVLYDGDPAGLKASLRGIDLLLAQDLQVRVVVFPEGEDPDSYSRKLGSTAFGEYLKEESTDFVVFKTNLLLADAGSDPVKRTKAARDVLQSIALLSDELVRSAYLQECAQLMNMEESSLAKELSKLLKGNETKPEENLFTAKPAAKPAEPSIKTTVEQSLMLQERETVRLLVRYGLSEIENTEGATQALQDFLLAELEDIEFIDPTCRQIVHLLKQNREAGKLSEVKDLLQQDDSELRELIATLSLDKYELSPSWLNKHNIVTEKEDEKLDKTSTNNILRLKYRLIKVLIEKNSHDMREISDVSRLNDHQVYHMNLLDAKKEIGRLLQIVIG